MRATRMLAASILLAGVALAQEKKQLDPQPKKVLPDFKIDVPTETPAPPKLVPTVSGSPRSDIFTPLQLSEVLQSVEEHYPLLRFAEQERQVLSGRLLSAMGPFDTNLGASTLNVPEGTYENYRFNIGLSQAFTSTGIRAFSNYRGGYGDFPSYSGGSKTADGGEYRGGISIPFLRDGSIDRQRANLQQAQFNREAAEPFVERSRLDFQRAAARAYWLWVANGERLKVVRELAKLADTRDKQISQLVGEKIAAKIDRANNLQNLLGRNANLVEAEQSFVQATLDLSLFLRDNTGRPSLATYDRLPGFPGLSEPDSTAMDAALKMAFERRPELRRLQFQMEAARVELRFAENQLLPAANGLISGVSDIGAGKPKSGPSRLDRNGFEVGLEFQVPIQRSDARGRVMTAQAEISKLNLQLKFQEDLIRSEVQSTFIAVERAYEQNKVAQERVKYANQVAEGERQLFRDGLGDLVRVNIQEQAAFEAEIFVISARLNYFRAIAEYKAALGVTD